MLSKLRRGITMATLGSLSGLFALFYGATRPASGGGAPPGCRGGSPPVRRHDDEAVATGSPSLRRFQALRARRSPRYSAEALGTRAMVPSAATHYPRPAERRAHEVQRRARLCDQ